MKEYTTALVPRATFSAPRLGPTTRSSMKSIGAASEPARSSLARFSASVFSRPVVWKFLPKTPWIRVGARASSRTRTLRTSLPSTMVTVGTRSMYTTDISLPTLALVWSNMRWPATLLRVTSTAGRPLLSTPTRALTISSPDASTRLFSSTGPPLSRNW